MARSKSRETVVALDLATKCGWAVLKGKKLIASGREVLWRGARAKVHRGERWAALDLFLNDIVDEFNPEVLAYERVRRHVGVTAAHVYGGLLAGMETFEFKRKDAGQPCPEIVPIEISTWRKASHGKGNATKLEVEKWVKRKFRYTAATDDEAEAIAIAEAVRRIRAGEHTP